MNPRQPKKATFQQLSQAVMPTQLNTILSDIDTMLASARQTIDQSLQQSSQLVDQSRQHLSLISQALENTASHKQTAESEEQGLTEGAVNTYQDTLIQSQLQQQADHLEAQNTHMKQVFTEQELAAIKSAEAAQQAMETTLKNMEQQLMQQNQAFEHAVAQPATEQEGE
ncbi:hypothetical protein L1285_15115 [Pseudoalteromonas sp. DL2-H2.2]|uniref:hypothetical protein n=1 Tax=Pseudoalteromonas sp. DL2-H2.2 TaxID=2908889 RepID=UPI001F18B0A9|nr:hypothetical protein [Pseudoalteromonas sp. DL2-H2.2]MCF2909653.1 hypothetical protein [Pseudoalteromonas sp. DL2-H2.2]